MSLSNWQNFKVPFARLDVFTRHEPFPSEELKATYIDGRRKPKRKDRTVLAQALERRWSDGTRR
jgi:hypothetical protein